MEIRDGDVFHVKQKPDHPPQFDGWRRVVGLVADQIAYVGQRSDRTKFIKRESFIQWARKRKATANGGMA